MQLGVREGGFDAKELPFDPTIPDDLAAGGNFRLETPLGVLDIMKWVPGIDADSAFARLTRDARTALAFGIAIRVCSLEALRVTKRATRQAPGPQRPRRSPDGTPRPTLKQTFRGASVTRLVRRWESTSTSGAFGYLGRRFRRRAA